VAADGRDPPVGDLNVRPSWRAAWRPAGWAAPGSKAAAGRLGRLAAQEGMKRVSLLSLSLLKI
jgi:hypothetical protein